MGDKIAETNAKMVRFCPELASQYAKYPLQGKQWMNPSAKSPKGDPLFISAPKGSALKMDYAHGAGRKGWGYYHMSTVDSYKILYARLTMEMPGGCCCAVTPSAMKEVSEWDDVKTICYNRSVASIPDDVQAKKDAISIAQGVAQAHYHEGQNFQLAVGMVGGLGV